MGPTGVLSAPDGPHVGTMNLATRVYIVSLGMYRCGPAPVVAIKEGNVFFGYDAPFIYAEVNGDYVVWMVDDVGNIRPITHQERGVGYSISTKAIGKPERMDITGLYKHPEGEGIISLSTLKPEKMASFQRTVRSTFFEWFFSLVINFSPKFVAMNSIDNTSTLAS